MVVVPEATVIAKGRLGPGQMIAVDLDSGAFFEDAAIKDRIAGEAPYADMIGPFNTLADLPKAEGDSVARYDRAELTRRQIAAVCGSTSKTPARPPRAVLVIQCALSRMMPQMAVSPTMKTRRSRSGLLTYSWT